jgi:hypothetical protein
MIAGLPPSQIRAGGKSRPGPNGQEGFTFSSNLLTSLCGATRALFQQNFMDIFNVYL